MILAIDVGNSSTILGTIDNGEIGTIVRIHTELNNTAAEYGIKLRQLFDYYSIDVGGFEGAIISSVVPPVTDAICTAVAHLTGLACMVVGPGMKTGMNVRIEDPGSLAGSLVVGSVAAIACYGCPVIILDFSTATTMTVVDEKACYRGGAIIPGVRLGLQALSAGTSLLPDISVAKPRRVIATNTVDAMRSGIMFGYYGLIKAIIPYCSREIVCDDNLLLKGLWVLYEKNRK